MLALPELCNWEMGEGERVSPPQKNRNRIEKKNPKNGRFLLEAAIVEYLRPWKLLATMKATNQE